MLSITPVWLRRWRMTASLRVSPHPQMMQPLLGHSEYQVLIRSLSGEGQAAKEVPLPAMEYRLTYVPTRFTFTPPFVRVGLFGQPLRPAGVSLSMAPLATCALFLSERRSCVRLCSPPVARTSCDFGRLASICAT